MSDERVRIEIEDAGRPAFLAYAGDRRMVVDYWEGTYGCGGIASGDVFLRWEAATPTHDERLLRLTGLEPVDAWVRSEIADLIGAGVFRVGIRGRGPFRKPALLLVKPRAWLAYLGNVPLGT